MPDYYMPEPNKHKNANWLAILLVIFLVVFMCSNTNIHKCNWEDCNYQNKSVTVNNFQSTWGYEEHTDGFYVELTHIAQPKWTYEQCEQYVFTGVE